MSRMVVSRPETRQGSVGSYALGFGLSLLLTAAAFGLVWSKALHGWALIGALFGLAVMQLLVQLLSFLHLSHESRPRWNLQVLVFAVGVVLIIVVGSLWIMQNLQYGHHAAPTGAEIIKDEGYQP